MSDLPNLPKAAYSLDLSDGFPTVAYSVQQMYDFAHASIASVLETSKGDGWISIDDRLPKHEQTVMLSGFQGNDQHGKRFIAIGVFHKDGMFYDVDDGDDFYPPTHWQPLPLDPDQSGKQEIAGLRDGEGAK